MYWLFVISPRTIENRHIHFSRSNLAGDGIVQMRVVFFQWVKVLRHHLSIN